MSPTRRRTSVVAESGPARQDIDGRRRTVSIWRRLGRGALVVAAGTAALALAGPFALRPFADVAGAAGQVTVAFVLDFGGASSKEVVGCIAVPASDSRYDALAAFASQQNLALPTYATSGLLCSIGGVPTSGCGQVVGNSYIYWSYYTGGATGWTYASAGAFGTVTQGDVEGWRFQDPGTGHPNDPPPRATPDHSTLCSTTPTSTTSTTTRPAGKGGGGAQAAGGAAAGGAVVHKAHTNRAKKASAPGAAAPAPKGAVATTTFPSTTTSTYPSESAQSIPDVSVPADPVTGTASITKRAVGAGPDPLIIGGLLVAALATAALLRWRRRPRTP